MDDALAIRRRRLLWRASHRGTKELDILVGRYVADRIEGMDGAALEQLEALLAMSEPELQALLLAPRPAAGGTHGRLIADMRRFHGLDG